MSRTLYDKLWDEHVVRTEDDGTALLYIDRHLVHEVTSPQAFDGIELAPAARSGRLSPNLAVSDHNVPTTDRTRTHCRSRFPGCRSTRSTPTAIGTASPSSR